MKSIYKKRIDLLRGLMANDGISAAIIPQTDPHQSEYIADHWQVRRWLSGFTGSAGTLVITSDKALLWTDSRYFIQATEQLDGTDIILMKDGLSDTPSISKYLATTLSNNSIVGYDGMLFSVNEANNLDSELLAHNINSNRQWDRINEIWEDRPSLPKHKIIVHEEKYAGQSANNKIKTILTNAETQGANAVFISALDEIAWTLNIRSRDVNCNPVATSFLYLIFQPVRVFFLRCTPS